MTEREFRSESRPSRPNDPERAGSIIQTAHGPVTRGDSMNPPTLLSWCRLLITQATDALSSLTQGFDPDMYDEPFWPEERQAYVTLFGGFLLMFNSWGIVNAYGTFSSYYLQRPLYGKDILQLNLVGSTQCFWILILSGVVGRLLDANMSQKLLWTGTVLVTAGQFSLSACVGYGGQGDGNYPLIWFTQGTVTALGMACFFVSSSQLVATWFKRSKGVAIGIVASGASISGLIYPVMLKQLTGPISFANAVRCYAALSTATCILAALIAKPNPTTVWRKPEHWNWRVFCDSKAFHNKAFTFLCLAIATLFFGFYAVFFNLEEWAAVTGVGYKDGEQDLLTGTQRHPRAIRTFYLLATMNGASTVGRIVSAAFCDWKGAIRVHTIVTFVASLLVFLLWSLAKTPAMAWAFVICFGVFSGAVIGLPPASVAYILGKCDVQQAKLGQWTGMMYTLAAIPALTGPLIAGHLITEYDSFLTVQMWSGACLFLSACFMAIAWYFRDKEIRNGGSEEEKEDRRRKQEKEDRLRRERQNMSQEGFSQATSIRDLEKCDDDDKESDETLAGAADDRTHSQADTRHSRG